MEGYMVVFIGGRFAECKHANVKATFRTYEILLKRIIRIQHLALLVVLALFSVLGRFPFQDSMRASK